MKLALTEPQEEFVFSPWKYPAMTAGLGAGKSEAGLVRLVLKMMSNPGISTAYYMPTYDLIKLRAMPGLEDVASRLGLSTKSNRSDYMVNVGGYGDMIFRSYDRPERIIAYEVAHSVVDEIDTLKRDDAAFVWRKVSERNRQKCAGINTIGAVTTVDHGYSGFAYARWGNNPSEEYHRIKAPTSSNPFLPDGYVEQIRENYDPILADLYLSGEFVNLTRNNVYHTFNRTKCHSDRVIGIGDILHIGLDFNVGGTCATVWVIDGANACAVDEFVSYDTADFVVKCGAYNNRLIIYPDASGRSRSTNATETDISMITSAGYRVDAPESNPRIRDRINTANSMFSHGRAKVNTIKCPNLTDALESQGYTDKGDPEKFNDHPSLDDWNDCAGYFLDRKFSINRPVFISGIGVAR